MTVRTRMAPSPTGELHIGSLRTVLYNYAWAKKNKGQFLIRIEDTDQARLISGTTERILQIIKDYGLNWDEGPEVGGDFGPYIQSQRLDIYREYIKKLVDSRHAYYCFCSKERLDALRESQKLEGKIPRYDRLCLKLTKAEIEAKLAAPDPHVIRQKLPDDKVVKFTDAVMGDISINTKELDDTVLMKSDGFPTYHLAVIVDDHLMEISHVLRAVEWISSTPKHILLYEAFGWEPPVFGHLTAILSPSGKGKMSKREGDVSARSFLEQGYLPEAVLNFLMLLGWSPKDDREFFGLEEFVEVFDLKDLNASNPAFDVNKLNHFNAHYIMQLSDDDLATRLKDFAPEQADLETLKKLAPLVKERMKVLADFKALTGFVFDDIEVADKGWKEGAKEQLLVAKEVVESAEWNTESLNQKFLEAIEKNNWKTGQFFMNLRLAVAGQEVTPPITECIVILGKDKTVNRIDEALKNI